MSVTILRLTPRDPIIARDGRPFGVNQGQRMRGLPWPLPSVIAGSFRTALVKADPDLNFAADMPQRLLAIEVAGGFPTVAGELYLPAPGDCLHDEKANIIHRVEPIELSEGEGTDLPATVLRPVRLTKEQAEDDFKAVAPPTWWPVTRYAQWLTDSAKGYAPTWFDQFFLDAARQESRDHVCMDADRGAAADSQLFVTAGLNATHLARHGVATSKPFRERFAEIELSLRVKIPEGEFGHIGQLNTWRPLGGERRLVHWRPGETPPGWSCPDQVK
jgi:CRISPR-associated protein Cmr3